MEEQLPSLQALNEHFFGGGRLAQIQHHQGE
jgi:hypothetical protein